MAFVIPLDDSNPFVPYIAGFGADPASNTSITKANSYGSDAQADAYFSTRLDTEAWDRHRLTGADPDQVKQRAALVSATRLIERLPFQFIGDRAHTQQVLSFPRVPVTAPREEDPDAGEVEVTQEEIDRYNLLPNSYKYPEPLAAPTGGEAPDQVAPIPNRVIAAQFEQALHLLSNEGILLAEAQPGQIVLGDLSITNPGRVSIMSELAFELLSVYIVGGSADVEAPSVAWGNDGHPITSTSFAFTNIRISSISSASARASSR